MVETIELGLHGLYYLTDSDDPGVFIAAGSEGSARELAALARQALEDGTTAVPGHVLNDHASGAKITIPDPNGMTPSQRAEVIDRLTTHMHARGML